VVKKALASFLLPGGRWSSSTGGGGAARRQAGPRSRCRGLGLAVAHAATAANVSQRVRADFARSFRGMSGWSTPQADGRRPRPGTRIRNLFDLAPRPPKGRVACKIAVPIGKTRSCWRSPGGRGQASAGGLAAERQDGADHAAAGVGDGRGLSRARAPTPRRRQQLRGLPDGTAILTSHASSAARARVEEVADLVPRRGALPVRLRRHPAAPSRKRAAKVAAALDTPGCPAKPGPRAPQEMRPCTVLDGPALAGDSAAAAVEGAPTPRAAERGQRLLDTAAALLEVGKRRTRLPAAPHTQQLEGPLRDETGACPGRRMNTLFMSDKPERFLVNHPRRPADPLAVGEHHRIPSHPVRAPSRREPGWSGMGRGPGAAESSTLLAAATVSNGKESFFLAQRRAGGS